MAHEGHDNSSLIFPSLSSEVENATSVERSLTDGQDEAAVNDVELCAISFMERYMKEGGPALLGEAILLFQQVFGFRPPGHPSRSTSLNNLANAILTRYQRDGGESDLLKAVQLQREALTLFPPGHSDRPASLGNLANTVLTQYWRSGEPSDLLEVIELHSEAVALRPPGHPNRSDSLNSLAIALLTQFWGGGRSDLSEIIGLHREALTLRLLGHPNRSDSLNNLANVILTQYQRDGEKSDLLEVISLHREAVTLRPPGHPNRSDTLTNLAIAILTQYEREGIQSDLLEVIDIHGQALTLRPPGHPNRPNSLNNLANAILTQYERNGKRSDLSKVIELHRETLNLRPPGHPNRSNSLNNLANALLERYRRDGGRSDLLEVVELHREAIILFPPGHPNRSNSLNNLAIAVQMRYHRGGAEFDLLEVIKLHKEALILRLSGHPDRSASLNNLANAILARYERSGNQSDLSEVIDLHMEALALRPPGHPKRVDSLNNLALILRLKFFRTREISDITAARTYQEEAFHNLTENHPWWSTVASSLAGDLFEISKHPDASADGGPPGVNEILLLLRNAVAAKTSPIPARLDAALRWIDIATEAEPTSALEAYRSAFSQLGGALALGRSLQDRHSSLVSTRTRSRPATRLAIKAALWSLVGVRADPKLAIELLDQGRNILLASVGQFRVDLSDVRRGNPDLADEFYRTSQLLDSAILTGQEIVEGKSSYEDPASRYQRVSADWETVVAKIRLLPDCESFLLPVPYIKLQEAAVGGPVIVVLVGEEQSTAIIVTINGEPLVVELPNASEEVLKTLYEELEDAVGTLPNDRRAIRKLPHVLSELWQIMVEPVIKELRDTLYIPLGARIWWYPTSWASFLPLHAAGSYTKGGSNVPDLYISSYTPTLQALRRARGRSTPSSDATQGPLVVAQAQTPGQLDIVHVNDEVKMVRRLVPEASLLSGDQGTKETVLKELRNHSWIHFACHGHPDSKDPFQSHFALHNGRLSLQDIITNDLPSAEFAYLSACHSAAPDRSLPDEGLTLAGGMQFAGFKSVVGTLWAMADDDAPTLARVFYNGVAKRSKDRDNLDCTKTAEALHEAIQKLREKGVPLYRWVNLVHYGI